MSQDAKSWIQPQGFLSTAPATPRERQLALVVIVLACAGFLLGVPYARVQLAEIPAFIPAYESALVVIDIFSAILLFSQVALLRSRAVLMVAAGYV
jgi:hypothetical protein